MKSSQQLQKDLFKTMQPHLLNINRASAAFVAFWDALPPSSLNIQMLPWWPSVNLPSSEKAVWGRGLWKAWTLEGDRPGFQT